MERVLERGKEPEPEQSIYDKIYNQRAEFRRLREQGKVVIKGKDLQWRQDRQALSRYYSYYELWPELAAPFWILFQIRVFKQSGKHTHQGGLALFVLDGKGYSIVDGVRYDWEAGDLVILPVKPGGCEHQHFNADPDRPAEWQAFIFDIHSASMGHPLEQKEEVKDWQKGPNVGHRA
ncbi:MAG: cupin domain-containing protein [Chloroflexi bacterium]|nr:cupin domain-containing protein [Chloroflexota bacterium]